MDRPYRHPLFRPKRALDEVNRQLLEETHDPRAEEATYRNPFCGKGTEYDPAKQAAAPRKQKPDPYAYLTLAIKIAEAFDLLATLAPENTNLKRFAIAAGHDLRLFVHDAQVAAKTRLFTAARHKDAAEPWTTLAQGIIMNLGVLATVAPEGSDIKAFAETSGPDLSDFVEQAQQAGKQAATPRFRFRGSSKRAEIKMHEDPKFLPPRHDTRTLLDQDIKDEMEKDMEEPVPPKPKLRTAAESDPAKPAPFQSTLPDYQRCWKCNRDGKKHLRGERRKQECTECDGSGYVFMPGLKDRGTGPEGRLPIRQPSPPAKPTPAPEQPRPPYYAPWRRELEHRRVWAADVMPSRKKASSESLPPKPGTAPIPAGTIRLFHYTRSENNIESIKRHGLLKSKGLGDDMSGSGPSAGVWASTQVPRDLKNNIYVEFWVKPEQISRNAQYPFRDEDPVAWAKSGERYVVLNGDVPPDQIVAVHLPWHDHAHYLLESNIATTDPYILEEEEIKALQEMGAKDEATALRWYKDHHEQAKNQSGQDTERPTEEA